MRLRLISVGRLPWYREGGQLFFFYTPRLGLPYIATVTPPGWDVEILDGVQVEDIDFSKKYDLVGFSVLTPFANDTYRAADIYRGKGVKVVMGGVHPTLVPEEARKHADSVVVGEGEEVWPRLLTDFRHNKLKPFYVQKQPVNFRSLPSPEYSLIKGGKYFVARGIQIVRGCPYGRDCKFCIVPRLFGRTYRTMPVKRAMKEVEKIAEDSRGSGVNVSACCALNHTSYIRSFAEAIRPMNVKWCGGGLIHRLGDRRLMKLFRDSGCDVIYTESEVTSKKKNAAKYRKYCDVVRMILDHGIAISYNFTVGFDEDGMEVIDDVQSFIGKTGLDRNMCAVQLFAPWPNTDECLRLEKEGRIVDRDWSRYDNTMVVFRPKQMTVDELHNIYWGRVMKKTGPRRRVQNRAH